MSAFKYSVLLAVLKNTAAQSQKIAHLKSKANQAKIRKGPLFNVQLKKDEKKMLALEYVICKTYDCREGAMNQRQLPFPINNIRSFPVLVK